MTHLRQALKDQWPVAVMLGVLVDGFRFDSDADVFRLIDKLTALGGSNEPS